MYQVTIFIFSVSRHIFLCRTTKDGVTSLKKRRALSMTACVCDCVRADLYRGVSKLFVLFFFLPGAGESVRQCFLEENSTRDGV